MVDGHQKECNMDLKLAGKRVLITGASQGIGKSTALAFLKEGAIVAIVSRGKRKLDKFNKELLNLYDKSRFLTLQYDCSIESELLSLNKIIQREWGGVDIVIANVGDGRSVQEVIPDNNQWNATWSSNFESTLFTARVFLPMLDKSNGNLLFVSSIAGIEAFGAPVDYSTAKAAIIAFAKNISRKQTNVRVNVVAPGNILCEGGSWEEKIKKNRNIVEQTIEDNVPMGRFGLPDEIADSILFLCSERASFITGSTLIVDGGQNLRSL
jgi:3-oxoacyl-[acyl-carrier protein] reductase